MLKRALAVPIMLERTFRRLRRRSIEHDRRRGGQLKVWALIGAGQLRLDAG